MASSSMIGIAQESVTEHQNVPTDSAQSLMSTVTRQLALNINERDQSSFQLYS